MKRTFTVLAAVLLSLGFSACGEPEVVVQAALDPEGAAEPVPLTNLPVRLQPYNRDAIFDSLEAAATDPQPEIPEAVLQQQAAVQTAQAEWQTSEARWLSIRDSLRVLSDQLQQMQQQGQRATPQYQQRFREFERLEEEVQQVEQRKDAAFAEFTRLQEAVLTQADSVRAARQTWADRAFGDFDQIVADKLAQAGREVLEDTTDASGLVTFSAPPGQWWVYARYTLPYQELYWNLPIEVTGDSAMVTLSRENAEVRPVL